MSLERYRALEISAASTKKIIEELEARLKKIDSTPAIEFGGKANQLLSRKTVELVLEDQKAKLTRIEAELAQIRRELEKSLPEKESEWREKVTKHKELLDKISKNVKNLLHLTGEILEHEKNMRANENYYFLCQILQHEPSVPKPNYFGDILVYLKGECERFLRVLGEKIEV